MINIFYHYSELKHELSKSLDVMSPQPPIACDLAAIPNNELGVHRENGEALFDAIEEIRELENGYTFKLGTESGVIQKAGAFVARERLCCPFFEFTLTIPPNHEPAWLKLTGNEGVKSYIKKSLLPKLDAL